MILHMLSGVALLLGSILFLRWAWLQKPVELMKWVKWLVIAGVIGSLLSAALGIRGGNRKHKKIMKNDEKMLERMIDKDMSSEKITQ
ncbi:MAG: hypothetical protein P1V18_02315 [Candidatus Gracilibacteria bacterium]|nr:hypothetical protein [Candidatus Gracilibacteria bacterium]